MNTTLFNLAQRMRTAMLCLVAFVFAQQAYAQKEEDEGDEGDEE